MMSMRRRLFREEAYNRRGQAEPIDGLLRVTAPHEWAVLAALALVVIGVVAWGIFGRIERSLSAGCILATPGERFPVVAEAAGTVVNVLVAAGDPVAEGQPVAYVRTPDLARNATLARTRLAALEATENPEQDDLAAAHAELRGLEALQAAGEPILSPYAGELASHALVPGHPIEAGIDVAVIRTRGGDKLEALAVLDPADARRLDNTMSARISAGSNDGAAEHTLDAHIQEIAPRGTAVPRWLVSAGLPMPPNGRLVRLALTEAPPLGLADGDACRVSIVLERERPVQMLASLRGH